MVTYCWACSEASPEHPLSSRWCLLWPRSIFAFHSCQCDKYNSLEKAFRIFQSLKHYLKLLYHEQQYLLLSFCYFLRRKKNTLFLQDRALRAPACHSLLPTPAPGGGFVLPSGGWASKSGQGREQWVKCAPPSLLGSSFWREAKEHNKAVGVLHFV